MCFFKKFELIPSGYSRPTLSVRRDAEGAFVRTESAPVGEGEDQLADTERNSSVEQLVEDTDQAIDN